MKTSCTVSRMHLFLSFSRAHRRLLLVCVRAGRLWASGHVDFTSSVKRLATDESPAEPQRRGEGWVRQGETERKTGLVFWWELTCVWDRVRRWLWFCVAGSSFSEVSVCLAVCQEPVGGRLVHSEIHSADVGGRLPFTRHKNQESDCTQTHTATHRVQQDDEWTTIKHLLSSFLLHRVSSQLFFSSLFSLFSSLLYVSKKLEAVLMCVCVCVIRQVHHCCYCAFIFIFVLHIMASVNNSCWHPVCVCAPFTSFVM